MIMSSKINQASYSTYIKKSANSVPKRDEIRTKSVMLKVARQTKDASSLLRSYKPFKRTPIRSPDNSLMIMVKKQGVLR